MVTRTQGIGADAPRQTPAPNGGATALSHLIAEFGDPIAVMRRIVDEAMTLIPSAHGASVELIDTNSLRCVAGTGILADLVGARLTMTGSLTGRAVQCGITLQSGRARSDSRVDRNAARRFGVSSLVCVPLRYTDRLVGALTVASSSARAFSDRDVATLAGLSSFVTAAVSASLQLSSATAELASAAGAGVGTEGDRDVAGMSEFVGNVLRPDMYAELEAARRVEKILADRLFHVLYQPIVDVTDGRLVMAEALSRFEWEPYRPPDEWFADAWRAGFGADLELAALWRAAENLERIPPEVRLAINLSPQVITHPDLAPLIAALDGEHFVIELTEHVAVEDYKRVRRALVTLREGGALLAIDDTGAGFASLSHIIQLAPDIIKLDRELVHRIDGDPVRRSLATAIVSFAADIGASVVAESIETPDELNVVRALGIGYAQGTLIGGPGTVEDLAIFVNEDEARIRSVNTAPDEPCGPRPRGSRRRAAS